MNRMRTLLRLIVMVPIGLALLLLALANRKLVALSFDPFGGDSPSLTLDLPLFVIIFLSVIAGVLIGGIALWVGQGRHRRSARVLKREADRLRREADALKANVSQQTGVPMALLGRR